MLFNMIKITNESKLLTKHIDGDARVNLMVKKCNSNQNWNSKGVQKKKTYMYYSCKKTSYLESNTSTCKNGKYLENVIDSSVVISDEIIEAM